MIYGRNYKGYPVLIALDAPESGQVTVMTAPETWTQVGQLHAPVQVALIQEMLFAVAKVFIDTSLPLTGKRLELR